VRTHLRRGVVLAVSILTVLVVSIPAAHAYRIVGSDAHEGGAYDIDVATLGVWTARDGHRYIRISVSQIGDHPYYNLRVHLDTRGDGRGDAVVMLRHGDTASSGRADCTIVMNGAKHEGRYWPTVGRASVCRFRAWMVHPTKRIRYRVHASAFYVYVAGPTEDRAPDRGWYS